MARAIALLEGMLLFLVGCAMLVFWAYPTLHWNWFDVAILAVKGLVLSLCCIVSFYYNDLYDFRVVRSFGEFSSRLLQAFGVAFILLAGFYTVFPRANIAGGPFISSLLIVVGLLLPLRFASYALIRSRPFTERVLILGRGHISRKILDEVEAQPHLRYAIIGVVEDGEAPDTSPPPGPVFGPLQRLDKIVSEGRPDRIIVALTDRRGRLPVPQLLNARMQRILVEEGVEFYERLTGKLAIESLTPSSLIFFKDFLKSRVDLAVGRAMSFLASIAGLLLFAPLLALIPIAIKLDSPGPIFFIQTRIGLYGRRFKLMKFRTMHPGQQTSEWASDNADRITRVGQWLRRFRLDELPQFINILRGDMNLVGPRPHPVSNYDLFIEKIPYYTLRTVVRPGVTGWAQVRYDYANNLEEETEKMRYDLYYIKHLSIWMDLRILLDTIKIVLFGRETKAPAVPAPAVVPQPDNGDGNGQPVADATPLRKVSVASHAVTGIQRRT